MKRQRNVEPLCVSSVGKDLLGQATLNKGTAFTGTERKVFGLSAFLPADIETIEQQAEKLYKQYKRCIKDIDKYCFLRELQDENETLFYYLIYTHLIEMMPIIYTPTVGEACEDFSVLLRRPRGLFISYPQKKTIGNILSAIKEDIQVIVVTDGSRVLGLGDLGVGAMAIPIGKLSLYTLCGGINPAKALPIMLDVGTNNTDLLEDPNYIGWRMPRVSQAEYDDFLDAFIYAVKARWPQILLQFEDFNQANALPLLTRYRETLCCFNDDIQGTAVVTVGTLLAACRIKEQALSQQIIVFAGAGTAGCGIAEQAILQMQLEGLSEEEARQRIYMVNKEGLVISGQAGLHDFQDKLSKEKSVISHWEYSKPYPNLLETVTNCKPTVLIGVSGQPNLFDQQLIETLHRQCEQPIILPLSNPSKQIEAMPADILAWTKGRAIIATGSPFEPVEYQGKSYPIAQCNNSYVFPGFGLAVVVAKIRQITDDMLLTASTVLAAHSVSVPASKRMILPPLSEMEQISREIAYAVAKVAFQQGHAENMSDDVLHDKLDRYFWKPRYLPYTLKK